ncbi:hypothetical protein SAMN05661010_01413 [Modicisalibacter muralis]|uniref:Uncharacterized protein n=1 Tax=Modicisalibacter muralis TaxID=119000 RepID=A0A1G9J0H4_9GAMM|nr:hypothetical protein [Halomonas muralis]SDL31007.1 hypothetical protein SAMN05661010_01413 [Halomonas muralis]
MFEWISQHKDVLSVFTSIGTLIIWLVYAQLLYLGFRRQRRPRIIINRGKRKDIDALCIISNMSAESIFVEYIIAELETSRGTITMDVTDFEQEYEEGDEEGEGEPEERRERRTLNPGRVDENTRQGPLESGDFLHIGSFSDVIKRLARDEGIEMVGYRPAGDLKFYRLTIRLITIYGPEDMPVGAERGFNLEDNDHSYALIPATWDTQRLASRRQRRQLRKMVQRFNATNFSSASSFRCIDNDE